MVIVDIKQAAELLQASKIIAFPTETVYGLGAIASDKNAVEKVFKAKNRPQDNPPICHFYNVNQILEYVKTPNPYALKLIEKFSPGPISYLLDLKDDSDLLPATLGKKTVICRIPNQEQTLDLIKLINKPLAGPSANISGRPSATNAQMVITQLGDRIDGVLDGGNSKIGLESTILDCTLVDKVTILRPGAIGIEELNQVLEPLNVEILEEFEASGYLKLQKAKAQNVIPGARYPHYSPVTPIIHIKDLNQVKGGEKTLLIGSDEAIFEFRLWQNPIHGACKTLGLGSKFNLLEISRNLYANLSHVDQMGVSKAFIYDENWGDSSLSKAITNRLSKVGIT